jgi:hypothetical protein
MPWCHPLGVDGRRCVLSRRTVLRFTLRNGQVDLVQIQLPFRARQNHAGAPCNPHSPDDCWLRIKVVGDSAYIRLADNVSVL